jgi:hypothetical protein
LHIEEKGRFKNFFSFYIISSAAALLYRVGELLMEGKYLQTNFNIVKYKEIMDSLMKFTDDYFEVYSRLTMFCVWAVHHFVFDKFDEGRSRFRYICEHADITEDKVHFQSIKEFRSFDKVQRGAGHNTINIKIPRSVFQPLLDDLKEWSGGLLNNDIILVRFCVWKLNWLFTHPVIDGKTCFEFLQEQGKGVCDKNVDDPELNCIKGFERFITISQNK